MIAVRPPEYFPPLEYTALVHYVDHFILADTFRFRKGSFQDRSKLRNAQGGHWITIPLFGQPEGAPIRTVDIDTGGRWREKHWRSFMYDYRTTMYFEFYEDTFRPFFDVEWTNLAECTCRSVELQTELYALDTPVTRASALRGAPRSVDEVLECVDDDRVAIDASTNHDLPEDRVQRFAYEAPSYRQNFEGFEPGMSGMDLLFNYGREAPQMLADGIVDPVSPS